MGLEPYEAELLEKAISFKKTQQRELDRLQSEVAFLKETLKSLSGRGSVSGGSDPALPQPVVVDDEFISTLCLRFLEYKRPFLSLGSWTSVDSCRGRYTRIPFGLMVREGIKVGVIRIDYLGHIGAGLGSSVSNSTFVTRGNRHRRRIASRG